MLIRFISAIGVLYHRGVSAGHLLFKKQQEQFLNKGWWFSGFIDDCTYGVVELPWFIGADAELLAGEEFHFHCFES